MAFNIDASSSIFVQMKIMQEKVSLKMSQYMCFGFKKALHLPQSGPHFPEPSLKLLFTGLHTIFESDIIGNMIDALKITGVLSERKTLIFLPSPKDTGQLSVLQERASVSSDNPWLLFDLIIVLLKSQSFPPHDNAGLLHSRVLV